ncbi:MAG: cobyrinate a,c-diamide synthase [Rhodospirillales bacterium]|nr:cobyrinate a,c-diamide synthase [Rhodospirillales bacterium]
MKTDGPSGVIVGAPASGQGKTVFTLGLLRHLANAGIATASAKVGPDYIDPAFHAAATGRACINLDLWAMRPETVDMARAHLAEGAQRIVCEGVMGLFDGAVTGEGSTAHLAEVSGWPVILVVDAAAQAASAAAVVRGFATHRASVTVAGVVFNRVGSAAHAAILRQACAEAVPEVAVLGCLPRHADLALPERHLGLVQATEHADLERLLDGAAAMIADHVDVDMLLSLARPWPGVLEGSGDSTAEAAVPVPPLGTRIAVASDAAFAFRYPLVVDGWRRRGADIAFFSPLADEAPDAAADAVYLPGGYPELHAAKLAANARFLDGVTAAAGRGALVFGECGGYMVLGDGLIDGDGARHAMAGLLPLVTSFAEPRLHLGYRRAVLAADGALGAAGAAFRGHEFHYAEVVEQEPGAPLFTCSDARGGDLGPAGLARGRVMGSFVHLIDGEGG